MADLSCTYLGLELRNPILVASCKLTSTVSGIKECEEAGAGAVVVKSLFEEQILADTRQATEAAVYVAHAEAEDYFAGMGKHHYMNEYLSVIEEAKKHVGIPIVGSVNCASAGTWIEYAERFEKAGADALELNTFVLPADASLESGVLEKIYLDIAREVTSRVKIPVAMKIGFHFSGMAHVISALGKSGLAGLVLFNRFYRPDFDIEHLSLKMAPIFSSPEEMAIPLHWIALMSGEIGCDIAATTGIHDAAGAVKQLLAGAKAAQLCTVLYKKGLDQIGTILDGVREWMTSHSFDSIADFCGILSQERSRQPQTYERSQYIQALVGFA